MSMKPKTQPAPVPEFANGEEFNALSDEEKERVWQDCDREVPESETRPLMPDERARWERIQARLQANAPDAVTLRLQKRLIERVDAFGAENGLTRQDVFVLAVQHLLSNGARGGPAAPRVRRPAKQAAK